MKNIIWAGVILVIVIGIILGCRYMLVVDSPVVAKIDRLTGDVWIVNAGVWRKVQPPPQERADIGVAASSQKAAQAK